MLSVRGDDCTQYDETEADRQRKTSHCETIYQARHLPRSARARRFFARSSSFSFRSFPICSHEARKDDSPDIVLSPSLTKIALKFRMALSNLCALISLW